MLKIQKSEKNVHENLFQSTLRGKEEGGRVSVDKTSDLLGFPGPWPLWQRGLIETRW